MLRSIFLKRVLSFDKRVNSRLWWMLAMMASEVIEIAAWESEKMDSLDKPRLSAF